MKYAIGVFFLLPVLLFFPFSIYSGMEMWVMAYFIDGPTLLAFIIVLLGVMFVTGEFKTFIRAVNALFSKKYQISPEDLEKSIQLLRLGVKVVIYVAVFHTIGAFIVMLGDIDDPSIWGAFISIILLTPMYAVIINVVFILPAIHILKNRQNQAQKPVAINEREVVNKLLELCYKQGISPEEILNADEINLRKTP